MYLYVHTYIPCGPCGFRILPVAILAQAFLLKFLFPARPQPDYNRGVDAWHQCPLLFRTCGCVAFFVASRSYTQNKQEVVLYNFIVHLDL